MYYIFIYFFELELFFHVKIMVGTFFRYVNYYIHILLLDKLNRSHLNELIQTLTHKLPTPPPTHTHDTTHATI